MRISVAILLPALLLAGCGAGPADPRGVGEGEVLLQVAATGRADTRPDEARFTVGVTNIAPTAAAATAANNETIERVMRALQAFGVREEHVRTQSVSLGRIGGGPDRGRYQAHNLLEIRVSDVARAGGAIGAATEAGANMLSGPELVVSDPEAASRSAYAQAFRAARARADAYAEAAGMRVARVLAIRDGGLPGPRYGPYAGNMAAPEEAAPVVSPPPAPDVRPGLTTSHVQVRADFALAPL